MDGSASSPPPQNRVLRYLAVLSAARDFGVDPREVMRIARRFDPFDFCPQEMADALADALVKPREAA